MSVRRIGPGTTRTIGSRLRSLYAAAVLLDSPAGYWRLGDRLAGTTCADSSGNGTPLTYQAPVISASGLQASDTDQAAGFINDTMYADASSQSTAFRSVGGSTITIEAIVNWSTFSGTSSNGLGDKHLFGRRASGANDGLFWMYRNSDSKMYLGWKNGSYYSGGAALGLSVGTTYHLAVTCDGTSMIFYVNGSSASTVSMSGMGAILTSLSTDLVRIGWANYGGNGDTGSGTSAQAVIDELAVYGSALSAARIAAHVAAMK